MKKLALIIALFAGAYVYIASQGVPDHTGFGASDAGIEAIARAYQNQQSSVQVRGEGVVTRILPDDRDGSQHQRFVLRLGNGQMLLVAHNIDLAPRIQSLQEGDRVEFYGEYEWNPQGGVIHWTHQDPGKRHLGGWLKHDGRTYD